MSGSTFLAAGLNLQSGIQLTPTLLFSHIAYADDAALPDKDVDTSSSRLTKPMKGWYGDQHV
jgi:hypothetical protein